MSDFSPDIEEVMLLASQMLDGMLAAPEVSRLETILTESPAARRWYCRFVRLHAVLQWRAGVVETAISIHDEAELQPDVSDTMIVPAIHEREGRSADACDLTQLPLILEPDDLSTPAHEGKAPGDQMARKPRQSFARWMRRFAIAASILVAVSIGAAVTIRSGLFRSEPPTVVATVTAGENPQWQAGMAPLPGGSAIASGRQLSLTGGRVEIAFAGGAAVVVEAPARFSADSPGTMSFTSGRMEAVVPPKARGFTVTAAGVSVKDLGTEFGLRCDQSGGTEVDVFRGTVEAKTTSDQPSTRMLVAGDAEKLSGGALTAVAGGADETKFPSHIQGINLPPSFTDVDVGEPSTPGVAEYFASDGAWILTGIGRDTWLSSDQFNLAYEKLDGDATITCLIATATTESDGWRRLDSKCGIMMRASLDPGSQFVDVVRTQSLGIQMIVRDENDTLATTVGPYSSHMLAPVWLKLSRVGNAFTGSYSRDGTTWTTLGTHVTELPATTYAGLIEASGDETHVGRTTIKNLSVTGKIAEK